MISTLEIGGNSKVMSHIKASCFPRKYDLTLDLIYELSPTKPYEPQ